MLKNDFGKNKINIDAIFFFRNAFLVDFNYMEKMRIDLLFILGKYQLRASFIDRVLAVLLKRTLYTRILSPQKG